jgi:hypothetical protein
MPLDLHHHMHHVAMPLTAAHTTLSAHRIAMLLALALPSSYTFSFSFFSSDDLLQQVPPSAPTDTAAFDLVDKEMATIHRALCMIGIHRNTLTPTCCIPPKILAELFLFYQQTSKSLLDCIADAAPAPAPALVVQAARHTPYLRTRHSAGCPVLCTSANTDMPSCSSSCGSG